MYGKKSITPVFKQNDRRHRGYNLAFLYLKNKDYIGAEKCAHEFLSVETDSAIGYKLLGEIEEALGKRDKAVKAFERSLELEIKQDVMIKLCDSMHSSPAYLEKLKFWAAKAESAGFREAVVKFDGAISEVESMPENKLNSYLRTSDDINNSSRTSNGGANTTVNSSMNSLHLDDFTGQANRYASSPDRSVLAKIHQQENVMKNILAQQESLVDTNRRLMEIVALNQKSLESLQTSINDLKGSMSNLLIGQTKISSNHLESMEAQREIKDAVYEIMGNNYDNDYGEEYGDQGVDPSTPSSQAPFSFGGAKNQPAQPLPISSDKPFPAFSFGGSTAVDSRPAASLFQPAAQQSIFNSPQGGPSPFSFTSPQAKPISALQNLTNSVGSNAFSTVQPTASNPVSVIKNDIVKPSPLPPATPQKEVPAKPLKVSPDIEIVREVLPSKALIAKAVSLQLPEHFYNYMNKSDCPGCIGCEKQDNLSICKPTAFTKVEPEKSAPPAKPIDEVPKPAPAPVAQPPKPIDAKPEETPKAFTFGFSSTSQDVPKASAFSFAAASTPTFKFGFGTDSSTTTTSNLFSAALEQQGGAKTVGWGAPDTQASWLSNLTNPKPIFGAKPEEVAEDELYDPEESNVDDSQFNLPQVALPEVIEIKTGEEDEEIVYVHRAKLYRYDKPTKQWKERGVGDIKILKHKDGKRYRMLLRREQVHKLACNHYINAAMTFSPMPNSSTSVSWVANDFSEGEVVEEFLAVKFKSSEILQIFLDKINEVKADIESNSDSTAKYDDVSD
ncbi:E3 SUMO-protein ligase RanBP2 [Halotydeus destructor]|nr:E3 SUMO-protein ligase RanBP2 [Halotydeus destructor]